MKLTHNARWPPAAPSLDPDPPVGESALMSVEIGGLVFVTIALLILVRAIRG